MIVCEQVEKRYGRKTILTQLSFEITEPKIIGLIGRNGVGKSTLLKILAGHVKTSAGKTEVIGKRPFQNLTVAANTILIEDGMTFPSVMNLEEILKSGKKFYKNFATDLAFELLKFSRISDKNHHHHLSKGQKAVFNLIYGIASRCAITLLDEPMNGMDETIRDDMYRVILKDFLTHPRVMIISSHYLNEMEHLIEEILLLHEGKVELFAPVEEVQSLAIKLVGQKENVEPALKAYEVLATYENGPIFEAIVKNSELPLPGGVRIQNLSASDVCKVLTTSKGGSIDDIYRNSKSNT
ncbi:ABC-2 type transport system ATP-binding protein [Solibacillus kalamii]|uniref:ABC transporter ATP-binding protein n=1 Tax=Solibacillus kalamii TaxID=1748298 RepID=A0ABX3ZCP5_9BACL|nr:ABC transporter ATP-binding protein [Solibacillus kalamii]MBM7666946.1 ABC-2 type transport system ATP-binding protein [Solibacillus kalamii]OUZ37488.1 ABC transporter ATP-binding protein [Solibacillus kalamii]